MTVEDAEYSKLDEDKLPISSIPDDSIDSDNLDDVEQQIKN